MKSIKIRTDKGGKEYTLAFTRLTARKLSRAGFTIDLVVQNPLDGIPMLFNGSLEAFHPDLGDEEKDKLFESISDKNGLLKVLMQMYTEPVETLLKDPKEKNATWEVVE